MRRIIGWAVSTVVFAMAGASLGGWVELPGPASTSQVTPRLKLLGRVLDSDGAPVFAATVEVDYSPGGSPSIPTSSCPTRGSFCWLTTNSNLLGEYAAEFDRRPWGSRGFGYAYAIKNGYETDIQWIPSGPSPAVLDLKLRPIRKIRAGDSIVVSVDPTSPLCSDLEDLFALDHRCALVVVDSGAGVLTVEATAVSGPPPTTMWYTSGNYAGRPNRWAPGNVTVPVKDGTFRFMVAIPDGAPAQQFSVKTSLK